MPLAIQVKRVTLTYDRPLEPATVTGQTINVYGMQSGRWIVPPNGVSVDGNTITVTPEQALHPGEVVSVTATQGIENADGQGPTSPYIMQFRTAVGQGNGNPSACQATASVGMMRTTGR